MRSWF
ncbi:hypothetical protein CGLO_13178 [Colletotrichum gloeosporioides Cg-14]